jgi:hypothetical protein
MMKLTKHSFTRTNESGSVSLCSVVPTADVSLEIRPSHSSSTSLSDRKLPVVSRTWFSTMKKPRISCVRAGRDDRGSGDGRMRSD